MTETTERDARFSRPMNHATQVEQLTFNNTDFIVAGGIAFDVHVHDVITYANRYDRLEGTIAELWVEDLRGEDWPYAEVVDDAGEYRRVWMHRDKAGARGTFGRAAADALW